MCGRDRAITLISASAEPRYQCQLQLIHAPSNTHQFLLSIVRSLSMSPHSVPSSRFRLVFLILAAVWCRELVFRQPCCVFTLCLDSSLITTIHLCCSSKSLCHSSPSYHCLLFTPLGYLIKYQNSLATCFLLFTMTKRTYGWGKMTSQSNKAICFKHLQQNQSTCSFSLK